MNDLSEIMRLQKELMSLLGINVDEKDPIKVLQSAQFTSTAIGAITEAAEVLSVLNTKARPWYDGAMNKDDAKQIILEEITDVMFYVIEMYALLGVGAEEAYHQYHRKWLINMARIIKSATIYERSKAFQSFIHPSLPGSFKCDTPESVRCLEAIMNLFEASVFKLGDWDTFIKDPVQFTRKVVNG